MAITFRGAAGGSVTNGGTVSIDLTAIAGLAQDDVVVLISRSSAGTGASVSGWTDIWKNQDATQSLVAYKVMGGVPDTSVSFWDTGGTSDSGAATALAFTGVDTATPLDVTAVKVSATTDPPAIVPTSDDCAIVVLATSMVNDATPGTMTNYNVQTAAAANDTNPTTAVGTYRILTGGAGASENPPTFSTFSSTAAWVATVALRPAGVAVGQPYDLHEGGVPFINPHSGGQNFQVW
jgi:hypothetical protein